VFHLATVEEALPADQMIANRRLSQRSLQRPRLLIGAEQNRLLRPRNAPGLPHELDFLDNRSRFRLLVLKRVQNDFSPLAFRRPSRDETSRGRPGARLGAP